jgi:DNA gyrase/topoisomerase IV subunit B
MSKPKLGDRLMGLDEHLTSKGMWMGSQGKTLQTHYLVNGNKFDKIDVVVIPVLVNMFMELLINVVDMNTRKFCHQLEVDCFDDDSIRVKNYSPGFKVIFNELVGHWEPFIKCAVPFQGSEHKKPTNSIIGGTNGLGLKVIIRQVLKFWLFTIDPDSGLCYIQTFWRNGRKPTQKQIRDATMFDASVWPFDFSEPQIIDLNNGPQTIAGDLGQPITISKDQPFTSIRILPDYESLGMNQTMLQNLRGLIESRCYQLPCQLKCPIYFNKTRVPIVGLSDFARWRTPEAKKYIEFVMDPAQIGDKMFGPDRELIFNHPQKLAYPCHVVIAIKTQPSVMQKWSMINGVPLEQGAHFKYLSNKFEDGVKERIRDGLEFQSSFVNTGYDMYISMYLSCPDWTQQTKGTVDIDDQILKQYQVPDKPFHDIIEELKKNVDLKRFDKLKTDTQNALKTTREKLAHDYTPAKWSGKNVPWNLRKQAQTFLTEGDSASAMISKAIGLKTNAFNTNNSGVMSIGGVPMNVTQQLHKIPADYFKKSTSQTERLAKNSCIPIAVPDCMFSKKFAENVGWQSFVKAMNLDYQKTYETIAEIQTLSVGRLIIAVDQDLDGMGNILSLILNFLRQLWPALFNCWIYWISTPIVRVFNQRKVVAEFNYENDFKKWAFESGYYDMLTDDMDTFEENLLKQNPTWSETNVIQYIDSHQKSSKHLRVDYFKGLDGHSKNMIEYMFKPENINKNIFRLVLDPQSKQLFREMFEDDSEQRKIHLRRPQLNIPNPSDNVLYCSNVLLGPLLWYSRDDLRRKLIGIDGLNDVRRRIVYGLIKYAKSHNTFTKTYMIASYIAEHTHYHHGNTSITDTLTKFGATYHGSNQILLVEGQGGFGSRKKNGGDAGAPRYTSLKPYKPVLEHLYPSEDLNVLDFLIEDGERTVPVNFAPVIIPIHETVQRPSHGWAITLQAIWYKDVINLSRAMVEYYRKEVTKLTQNSHIEGEPEAIATIKFPSSELFRRNYPLRPNITGWKGKNAEVAGKILTIGKFTYNRITHEIIITELPMGMSVETYMNARRKEATDEETKKIINSHPFIQNITNEH